MHRDELATTATADRRGGVSAPAVELGRVGIWTFQFDRQPIATCLEAACEIERLGYPALWVPEQRGREAMSLAALLLSATEHLVIANGIARASVRDARSMVAAQRTLAEAFPGRYLLGIGGQTRLAGDDPIGSLRHYLDEMDAAEYRPPRSETQPRRVLAAINRRMLELAAGRSWGALTYLCPPEHVRWAREILGPAPLLAVEQPAVLDTEPARAREVARRHLSFYLALPAYQRMLARLGFERDELADGGSDQIIDTIVVWGNEDAIHRRIQQHLDAGATHVCLQVLPSDPNDMPVKEWRRLSEVARNLNLPKNASH